MFYEVRTLIDDVMAGVEKTFFHRNGPRTKAERPTFINPERAELLVNGDLSAITKNKRNLPVFKTSRMKNANLGHDQELSVYLR